MTSGRKLTDAEQMAVLRWHEAGRNWEEIGKLLDIDYRTVKCVVCQAARWWYREHRRTSVDEAIDQAEE
jgi:DNA-binding NarL/FixJ family response regulator